MTIRRPTPPAGIETAETIEADAVSDTLAAGSDGSDGSDAITAITGPGAGVAVRAAVEVATGERIDRYVIETRLGAGGMGVVYAAHDPELDRRIAVKLLHPRAGGTGDAKVRLLREAQAIAKVTHPNVIAVHDVGTWQPAGASGPGQVFVAMELVDGWNLRQWRAEKSRTWRELLGAFLAAGRGLEAAHAAGLIHRDIKPDNILVGRDGRIRVTDFGLARMDRLPADPVRAADLPSTALSADVTQTGALLGTPAYMAPEQFAGDATDARSDQFSFCVALWEGLYGERPFAGDDLDAIARAIVVGELRDPPAGTRVPAWVRRAVTRGLASDPAKRWPSMTALLAALSAERRRLRWIALAAGAAVLAAGGITLALAMRAPSTACRGADRALVGIWDPATKQRVAAAFGASGMPGADELRGRVEQDLDRYVAGWVAMRTEACEATRIRHQQPEALMEMRIRCLDARLGAVKRIAELASNPDRGVMLELVPTIARLSPVDGCANTAALLAPYAMPMKAEQAAAVLALEAELQAVEVDLSVGRIVEMEAWLAHAAERAKAIGWAPLEAIVLQVTAGQRARAFDYAGQERMLREAIQKAEIGQYDAIRAGAAIDLIDAMTRQARHAEAEQWVEYARAVIARLGDDPMMLARLHEVVATLRSLQGRHDEADGLFAEALALRISVTGGTSLEVAGTRSLMADNLRRAGKLDAAREMQAQASAVWAALYGPESMGAALDLQGRATDALVAGDYAKSIELDDQAQALLVRMIGPDDPTRAAGLASQALAFDLWGKHEESIERHRQCIALLDTTGMPSEMLADQLSQLGAVALDLGRTEDALAAYQRAETTAKAVGKESEVTLTYAQVGLGKALVAAKRPKEAIAPLETALAARIASNAPPNQLGAARFALARALWLGGGDRARAKTLAADALADLQRAAARFEGKTGAEATLHQRMLGYIAEVEAWRGDH